MARIGILGLGFMGKMHFRCLKALDDAQIVALCDIDQAKLKGGRGEAGNIAGAEEPLDLSGISLYSDFEEMLTREQLDAVSIPLPTYLHCQYTVKALEAGLDVLCEKPMALDAKQCEKMITAATKNGRYLQVGHCIRFWPEYAKTKKIIDTSQYGTVKAATFQRLSLTPTWSWNNWIVDGSKSGGAMLDLHIHDADFVQYLFGMPRAVYAKGVKGPSGDFDHVVCNYSYDDDKVVTAEGGWIMAPSFGFEMSFNIILEKATISYDCTRDPTFKVCPVDGDTFSPEVQPGDGYSIEIAHFIDKVNGKEVPQVLTPAQSLDSIQLIIAEKKSASSGEKVKLL